MDSEATIVIHYPSSIKIYIAVNRNWWLQYLGSHLGRVHKCSILECLGFLPQDQHKCLDDGIYGSSSRGPLAPQLNTYTTSKSPWWTYISFHFPPTTYTFLFLLSSSTAHNQNFQYQSHMYPARKTDSHRIDGATMAARY